MIQSMKNKQRIKIVLAMAIALLITQTVFKGVSSPAYLGYIVSSRIAGFKNNLVAKVTGRSNIPPAPIYASIQNPPLVVNASETRKHVVYYKGKKLIINSNTDDIPKEHLEVFYLLELEKDSEHGKLPQ